MKIVACGGSDAPCAKMARPVNAKITAPAASTQRSPLRAPITTSSAASTANTSISDVEWNSAGIASVTAARPRYAYTTCKRRGSAGTRAAASSAAASTSRMMPSVVCLWSNSASSAKT